MRIRGTPGFAAGENPSYYGDCEPALSYVSQPPLNAPLLMEVHSYVPDAQRSDYFSVIIKVFPYVLLENASGRFLFAGGFKGMYSILV